MKKNKHWVLLQEDKVVAVVNDEKIMKKILAAQKKYISLEDMDLIKVPEVGDEYLAELIENAEEMTAEEGEGDKPITLELKSFGQLFG